MTIDDLIMCQYGTVLIKGNRRRIYWGWTIIDDVRYIAYSTPSRPKKFTLETDGAFAKWLKGAIKECE